MTLSKINQLANDKAGNCCWSQNLEQGLPLSTIAKKVLMSSYNVLDTKHICYSFFNPPWKYEWLLEMFDDLSKATQLLNNRMIS